MRAVLIVAPAMKPLYRRFIAMRRSQFDCLPALPDRVVFLGDSITDHGAWGEWFSELPVINRGISGDTVGGLLGRLESAVCRPRAVSLMIGTNDLVGLGTSRRVLDIAAQMDLLLGRLRELAPDGLLLVNSVLPRWPWLADDIEELNGLYRRLAAEHGATYVDLWPVTSTPERSLRAELTSDSTHLNGPGYQVWVEVLRPHLAPFMPTVVKEGSDVAS